MKDIDISEFPDIEYPKLTLSNIIGNFKTVTHHRHLVRKYCFKMGLYRQGLMHDLSKYSPSEFWISARFYQGNRSPHAALREQYGFSPGWLHHKGRNKHHYEYWLDFQRNCPGNIYPCKMPDRYIAEMVADRIAACRVYKGDAYTTSSPLEYYNLAPEANLMHPYTREKLELFLHMIEDKGEDYTLNYIKHDFLKL
ncbi:MAG: DUF5662 family protein [Butyrivibrio sp.]|nr:DUF5662 family protein [Butyrivibrio sp.]